ncbi:MAG: hypothetical protein BGO98_36410 [Myxococcales bacterium 68-20]|nr:hypothetical protein [Myxococcales bacterium]OJY26067.1 MAG: hypothetical protein BGO98_36410 [Myxococcales bacterium 68-20]
MGEGSALVEQALEELYSMAPRDFTKKRDAIAKELKAQGNDEAASAVRARRKPMTIAWVLNQLARRYPDDIAELVDVGRELAREQRKPLRGEASGSFRESIERQRKVVGGLTRQTADLMKELGVQPSGHLNAIASALQAALVDPAIGAQLEEGRLEKAPEAVAGFAGPLPSGPRPKVPSPPPKKARADRSAAGAGPSRRAEAAARKREEARERPERRAQALAQKRALAEERAERQAAERAEKEAVAAVRAAEREAEKRHKAAMEAEEQARAAIERAKELTRAAEESAQRVADAKRQLAPRSERHSGDS